MRLKDKVAIVVGAGQSPGEGMGNGRATALTFAREGAKVLCVDHHLESAQETGDLIAANRGTAAAFKADVTKSADIKAMVADAKSRWGRIDVLHNNVGVSLSGGDAELHKITEEAFARVVAIAALFLASFVANFFSGVSLPVDGGACVRRGLLFPLPLPACGVWVGVR